MAKRRNPRKALTPISPESTVWMGSGGFRDSDSSFGMAFHPARYTQAQAERKLETALRAYGREMWRGGDYGMTLREFMDDLVYYGVHQFEAQEGAPSGRDAAEYYDDLSTQGSAYTAHGS